VHGAPIGGAPPRGVVGCAAAPQRPCDPAVREALRAIYAEHTEKTGADVDEILARFAGREAGLLVKVKAKYSATA
jgi:hypothetical protein